LEIISYELDVNFTIGPSFGRSETRQPIITPTSVDLRPVCPPIQNQGDLGTCGVTALTSFLEFITQERLSVLFIYYATRVLIRGHLSYDDSGVEMEDCITALDKYGLCRDETWPYEAGTIVDDNISCLIPIEFLLFVEKFCETPTQRAFEEARQFRPTNFRKLNSIQEMKETLRSGLPFFCDVNFAPDTYCVPCAESGVVPRPKSLAELDPDSCEHTVLIVGYDDETEYFIFQNSWGSTWGKKGLYSVKFIC
jgi:C1A family cysteine protease